MKKWPLLLLLLSFLACQNKNSTQVGLQYNPMIKQYFNKYQRADLEKILTFFEAEICLSEQRSADPIMDCYEKYLSRLAKGEGFGNMVLNISLEKLDNLIDQLHKVTYTSLWSDGKSNETATPSGRFGLKYGDRYHRFLSVLGEENEKIKQYEATFEQTGTITRSMIADMLVNYADYNLSDERVRLVIAVHYLTLNKTLSENKEK